MGVKTLSNDLDNCVINFDRKVVITDLLDEYGGSLEKIAETLDKFLSAEESSGKKFNKSFLIHGIEKKSANERITIVPERKLSEIRTQLEDVRSMLYSAEVAGGSRSLPPPLVPLKYVTIQLEHISHRAGNVQNAAAEVLSEKPFKEPAKTSKPVEPLMKKTPPDNDVKDVQKKSGSLQTMFKTQQAKSSPIKAEPKQEERTDSKTKSSPMSAKKKKDESGSKKGITSFFAKSDPSPSKSVKTPVTKSPKIPKVEKIEEPKEEPAVNMSVDVFESSSSSDDEAYDALKQEVLADEENEQPSVSTKRRRVIASDDDEEEDLPGKKVAKQNEPAVDCSQPKQSQTFMDDDGFIVTIKGKAKPSKASSKIKRESPKKKESPKKTPKKESKSAPPAKNKQGSITSFFKKK